LPHEDHILHAVINRSLSDVGRPAEPRAQAVPKHLERKMMLATARNDDLEDPEAVKVLPGMRAHPNLRPRHRLAQFPYGTRGAQKT
jgi:hypothetical protein